MRGEARDVILVVHIDPLDPAAERLWTTIGKIAQTLSGEQGWCLVGGLMVQLFAHEAGQRVRPTTDIDILGDARRRPSATKMLAEKLQSLGGQLQVPSGVELTDGYQFLVEGELVEILAPDGLSANTPPLTIGKLEAIRIPGGTQALRRIEEVDIVVGSRAPVRLRRPTLLGAILLKARSLEVHREPEGQRSDLVLLLSIMSDPRAARQELKDSERAWLKRVNKLIGFSDPALRTSFTADQLVLAEAAYTLLIQ